MKAINKPFGGFRMPISLTLAPGIELRIDETAAGRLHEDLSEILGESVPAIGGVLPDDHPRWAAHSGGSGHDGPEWSDADAALAEAFYASVRGKAKIFFDALLDRPGRELTVDDIVAVSGGQLTSSFSVAGAINGLRLPHNESGRRYPFCWWAGTPTSYAVKPSVAALFNAARAKGGR
jgi:hypothetical protein